MSDGDVAGECGEVVLLKGLAHQPHRCSEPYGFAVSDRYAGALLTAMLKRVEPEEGHPGDVFAPGIDPYNAAGLSRIVLGSFLCLIMIGKFAG